MKTTTNYEAYRSAVAEWLEWDSVHLYCSEIFASFCCGRSVQAAVALCVELGAETVREDAE